MKYIKSKRLILRDWTDKDINPFFELNQDPDVRRYFPNKELSQDASKQYIFDAQKQIEDRGFGLFAVERRDSNEFIGFVGLKVLEEDGPFNLEIFPCVEIGWRLRKKDWNKGYATEAARAVIKFAKKHTDIKTLYSIAPEKNTPSINVMEKVGMTKLSEFDHPLIEDGHSLKKHVVYALNIK